MTGEAMTSRVSAVGGNTIAPHLQPPNANHPVQALRTDDIEVHVIEQATELHSNERKGSANSAASGGKQGAACRAALLPVTTPAAATAGTAPAATNGGRPSLKNPVGWVCCAPCIWLRGSSAVHKMAITAATLLVTSLLVASPILFLISAAPSQLPKDCYVTEDDDCYPTPAPPPECSDSICRAAAISIQTRMNWDVEPCKEFKNYSCSPLASNSLRAVKSPQEIADIQMQQLLSLNTTSGLFRKLGRLYGSCLRQTLNDSTIKMQLDKLGGYLQIGSVGPQSISPLISKIKKIGPMPIIGIYYDLSYGRKPQTLLIIDGPTTSAHILEKPVRWHGPKAAPNDVTDTVPELLDELINVFLPPGLSIDQRQSEKKVIFNFVRDLNQIRRDYVQKDFSNSYVLNNVAALISTHPFLLWQDLLPANWTGPIVIRSPAYLEHLRKLMLSYQNRVIHNALLLLFALNTLPPKRPSPIVCAKATNWALPEVTSSLFVGQYSEEVIAHAIHRTEEMFENMKQHLKRAPSLRGAALVRLSQLKVQAKVWPTLFNRTEIASILDKIEITSDNWFENVLKIYQLNNNRSSARNLSSESTHTAYAYPQLAKIFYDTLSHSIVVPLSVILVPYFNPVLPQYLHYATLGTTLAKEILRSITRAFESKVMQCVPNSVDIFSNSSRMDLLIYSGGMQIAYHTLLSLSGPIKGMNRLPGLSLTPPQIFYLMSAQELCAESEYNGVDVSSNDFDEILTWLISQGGSASDVFQCHSSTMLSYQKNCDIW
ncbi:neprilysin-3 [Toxorhynchites rutilus septentrionalis]|uniref:neprilysin-3 n=1 Tax=Toxorhynchites rutilus septentrionalis TaxID=329112 RepID=UPI002478652E|nr:neprilysin-3 [Toxorhynchites rutilus septentrionalis]XP_055618406.1 neprilysin-3 [Toxorhynchites rutilus septentrionalis]XP_055618407.1 neprilysin-3 [Toxorhynchites rutilus septentrionalis]XP_055618408.1 neprilysin-3 [Toxorhynchites rutilus septentrionalis]XP_055618409.1 neprilysin-3 [Toxorhynchites rutilus septentrionalis]